MRVFCLLLFFVLFFLMYIISFVWFDWGFYAHMYTYIHPNIYTTRAHAHTHVC